MIRNPDVLSGEEDARFLEPLLTVTEAGRNLLISPATVKDWKTRELVHSVAPVRRGAPTLPLAGVAEAQVLRGLRLSGLPSTEIVRVTRLLREELGEYALIKERLATMVARFSVTSRAGLTHRSGSEYEMDNYSCRKWSMTT